MTDESRFETAISALEGTLVSARTEAAAVADTVSREAAPIRACLEGLGFGTAAAHLEVAVARCHATTASWEAQASLGIDEELALLRALWESHLAAAAELSLHPSQADTDMDRQREDTERAWARGMAMGLFGGIGAIFGEQVGAAVGGLSGPLALERILRASDERASRVEITQLDGRGYPGAATPPQSLGQILQRIDATYGTDGLVRVDRLRREDGSEIAMVYIPGTQAWIPGTSNPADVVSAIAAATGANSAWRQTILSSLAQAGVSADAPVVLAGHSLGGFAALDLAADPYVRASYAIHSVVTAGAGGGNFVIPEHITVISVRQLNDITGYLGGTRAETSIEVKGGWVWGNAHSIKKYTALAEASDDPEVRAWHAALGMVPGISGTSSWFKGRVRDPE